jgi:hypothetical protein
MLNPASRLCVDRYLRPTHQPGSLQQRFRVRFLPDEVLIEGARIFAIPSKILREMPRHFPAQNAMSRNLVMQRWHPAPNPTCTQDISPQDFAGFLAASYHVLPAPRVAARAGAGVPLSPTSGLVPAAGAGTKPPGNVSQALLFFARNRVVPHCAALLIGGQSSSFSGAARSAPRWSCVKRCRIMCCSIMQSIFSHRAAEGHSVVSSAMRALRRRAKNALHSTAMHLCRGLSP